MDTIIEHLMLWCIPIGMVGAAMILISYIVSFEDGGYLKAARAHAIEMCADVPGRDFDGCMERDYIMYTKERWEAGE